MFNYKTCDPLNTYPNYKVFKYNTWDSQNTYQNINRKNLNIKIIKIYNMFKYKMPIHIVK